MAAPAPTSDDIETGLSSATSKTGRLQRALLTRLRVHERDGDLPTSARFLFYELTQAGVISKAATGARRADRDLHDALTHIRETGLVPWDWIIDETRLLDKYETAPTVAEYVATAAQHASIDRWDGQRVLYLGDFDWCGHQIEANTRRTLEEHCLGGEAVNHLLRQWERVALTEAQVREYDLPVILKADRRYKPVRHYDAVETEAFGQARIVAAVRERLDELMPEPLDDVLERQDIQRTEVAEELRRLGGAFD